MIRKFKIQDSGFKIQSIKFYLLLTTIFCLFLNFACSVPNLEKPECVESREIIKQFYSNHFGGDLKPNQANLEKIRPALTANLFEELKSKNESAFDYFTQTEDYPKAFRVGGCEAISENKTIFEILLFWKDEVRNEQREIKVETVKESGKWLINKVETKK